MKEKEIDPAKLAKASKIWREATKGLDKKERRDFAKWLDEISGAKR